MPMILLLAFLVLLVGGACWGFTQHGYVESSRAAVVLLIGTTLYATGYVRTR